MELLDIDWNTIVFHLILLGVSYLLALQFLPGIKPMVRQEPE